MDWTKYRFSIILFFALITTSCSIEYYVTPLGFARPVDEKVFSYDKHEFTLSDSSHLDTNCIYCHCYPSNAPEYFDCYKFSKKGKVNRYEFTHAIDTAKLYDNNFGGVGRYHVDGNTIRIQQFAINHQHFREGGGGTLLHYIGSIRNDSIIINSEQIGKGYHSKNLIKGYDQTFLKTDIPAH